ncbi:MAG: hypothetical protein WBD40_14295 [Tepidisphaeraceae bacterium]
MKKFSMLFVAALAVLAGMFGAASAQAATGIRVSSSSIGAGGRLTMNGNVICDVLLTLTLTANPIAKRTGVNQGTAAGTIRNCSGGGATGAGTVLAGITVQYQSFSGTLPNITRITINAPNAGFQLATIVGNCLYGGNLTGVGLTASALAVTAADFGASATLPRVSGSGLCPASAQIRGVLAVLGTPPTITLV